MTREKLEHMNPRALYLKCRSLGIAMRRGETPPKAEMVEAILNFEKAESLAPSVLEDCSFLRDFGSFNAKKAVEEIEVADQECLMRALVLELGRDVPRKTVLAALEARGIEIPTTKEENEDTPTREVTDGDRNSDNPSGEEVGGT